MDNNGRYISKGGWKHKSHHQAHRSLYFKCSLKIKKPNQSLGCLLASKVFQCKTQIIDACVHLNKNTKDWNNVSILMKTKLHNADGSSVQVDGWSAEKMNSHMWLKMRVWGLASIFIFYFKVLERRLYSIVLMHLVFLHRAEKSTLNCLIHWVHSKLQWQWIQCLSKTKGTLRNKIITHHVVYVYKKGLILTTMQTATNNINFCNNCQPPTFDPAKGRITVFVAIVTVPPNAQ